MQRGHVLEHRGDGELESGGVAALLAVAAALGGTPGWYGYPVGFFVWVTLLARRTVAPAGHSPAAAV